MDTLIILGDKPLYGLFADGSVQELTNRGLLEVCAYKETLEARKRQWEFNYNSSPAGTRRPPWVEDLLVNKP